MRNPFCAVLGVCVLVVASAACSAGDGTGGFIPADHFETGPGLHMYMFQDKIHWQAGVLSARRHITTDCVTAPIALEISFPPAAGGPGRIAFDTDHALGRNGQTPLIPDDVIGMSFFIKGDGSEGFARLGLAKVYEEHASFTCSIEIPLSSKKWRHVILKWSDLSPAVDVSRMEAVLFGLTEGSPRPAHYILDALRFVRSTDVEPAFAALANEANARKPEIEIPRRPSAASCTYNKGGLAKARAKLREGKPMKWLAYGDSVTVPVQMFNVPEELIPRYAYYGVAAAKLTEEFGSTVEVVVDAVGGRQLNENFQSLLDSLEKETPDVLILLGGDSVPNYRRLMPQVVAAAEKAGTELLVVVPTYDSQPYKVPSYDWLRRWAVENGIACIDARRYLLGVPEQFWADTTANSSHPNPTGHRLIGEAVAEMFR